MRPTGLALIAVAASACHDFDAAYDFCVQAGHCADAGQPVGDAGAGGGIDAGPLCASSPLAGSALIHWAFEDGGIDSPPPFVRLFGTCDGGAWTADAVIDATGNFYVDSAPNGALWIATRDWRHAVYLATDQRQLTIDLYGLGRSDVSFADAGTVLSYSVTGLDTWTFLSVFSLMSPSAGIPGLSNPWLNNAPALGATTLNQATADYWRDDIPTPLVDAARGDRAIVFETSIPPPIGSAQNFVTATRAAALGAVTITDGVTNPIATALSPVAMTGELKFLYTPLALGPLLPDNPALVPQAHVAGCSQVPLPWAPTAQARDTGLAVSFASLDAGTTQFDYQHGTLVPGWVVQGSAGVFTKMTVNVGGQPVDVGAVVNVRAPESDWAPAGNPMVMPPVGTVRSIRINGGSAYVAASGVGTSPSLSWTAPAVGSPTGYQVDLIELPSGRIPATLYTTQTTLSLPPGILVPGNTYVLRVGAVVNAAATPTRPLQYGLNLGLAENATAPFSP